MIFWPIAVALTLLALCFILYPLFFHRPETGDVDDIRHQNLQAYRSRLAELEAERAAGHLDAATFGQMKEELSASLLDDVNTPVTHARQVPGRRSALIVVLASIMVIPVAAFTLYQDWGAKDAVGQARIMEQIQSAFADHQQQRQQQELPELAQQLRDRLVASPDNLEGWSLLGQTYMNLENYSEAAWAYQHLAGEMEGAPQEAATAWGFVAQARFFESRGAMNDAVKRAIDQAQQRNPDEVNALGLLGVHAFEQENYREAIKYWGRIIQVAPDNPQSDAIRQGLVQAYRRLGEPVPQSLASASGASVIVRVRLAEKFRDQVASDTTLFVYAREAGGSPMPLAAAKLTASQLPVTLTLDDSMAMTPNARLSDAKKVILGARLSKGGSVQANGGGWQGVRESPVDIASYDGKPVIVTIDRPIP